MSVTFDLFIWLIVETILGFLIYSTGCTLLKIATFGKFKSDITDYVSFKVNKAKNVYLICMLGFSFYVLLIGFVAYLSY